MAKDVITVCSNFIVTEFRIHSNFACKKDIVTREYCMVFLALPSSLVFRVWRSGRFEEDQTFSCFPAKIVACKRLFIVRPVE